MVALLLITTLAFETPMVRADSLCGHAGAPLSGVVTATLYGTKRHEIAPRVLASRAVPAGGVTESIAFEDSGAVWTCWVTFTDSAGRASCPSNFVTVSPTTSVLPVPPEPAWVVYDVAGRIVATGSLEAAREHLAPGFYVARRGVERRAMVVRR